MNAKAQKDGGPIFRPQKAAERAVADDLSQAEKFGAAAREHRTDQDEEAFKGVLRKLGKAKTGR